MKKLTLVFVLLLALLTVGCSKDEEVLTFIADVDTVASEIDKRVTGAEDLKAGIADAQAYLDGEKAALKATSLELADVRGFQVKEETMAELQAGIGASMMKVSGLQISQLTKTMGDKEAAEQLKKLIKDFEDTLR